MSKVMIQNDEFPTLTSSSQRLTLKKKFKKKSDAKAQQHPDSCNLPQSPSDQSFMSSKNVNFSPAMESLLPIINELQLVFKHTGMEEVKLPQIVVVGSQSCGKSSVLESLVRKSFLPRGTGIVTRCPIILQLNQIPAGQGEWCEFVSEVTGDDGATACGQSERYTDYDKLREAIEAKTNEVAGTNKGITSTPLIVRIFAPNVVSLTVVDLPGMVKVPTGDQPFDIEKQVMDMILYYIANPNAIILAVCPGNVDMATSESIKVANTVDPVGNRTLAVITKLDLLDRGVTAVKELEGIVIPVKLGIVGVINRSQQDLLENKSVEESLEDELVQLELSYPTLAGRIGSIYLAKRLNQLLLDHIRKCLPELKHRISELSEAQIQLLENYGTELPIDDFEMMRLMAGVLRNFEENYEKCVKEGALGDDHGNITPLGSPVAKSIQLYCAQMLDVDGLKGLEDKDIEKLIRSTTNWERLVSVEHVFKTTVRKQIRLLEEPCQDFALGIHKILGNALKPSLKDRRVPKLNAEISAVMRRLLDASLCALREEIKCMFEEHLLMIFTTDEKFNNLLQHPTESSSDMHGNKPVTNGYATTSGLVSFPMSHEESIVNTQQLAYIKKLVITYFHSVRNNIVDFLPKRTMRIMYSQTMKEFQIAIKLALSSKLQALMIEPEHIMQSRKKSQALLKSLEAATEILNRIQDTCID